MTNKSHRNLNLHALQVLLAGSLTLLKGGHGGEEGTGLRKEDGDGGKRHLGTLIQSATVTRTPVKHDVLS